MGFTEFSCNCLDNIPFQRYRHDSAILMGIHQVLTGTWVQGSLRIDDLLPYLLRTKCLKAILKLLLLLQISFLITDLFHNSFYWLSSLSLTKVLHFITEDSEIPYSSNLFQQKKSKPQTPPRNCLPQTWTLVHTTSVFQKRTTTLTTAYALRARHRATF